MQRANFSTIFRVKLIASPPFYFSRLGGDGSPCVGLRCQRAAPHIEAFPMDIRVGVQVPHRRHWKRLAGTGQSCDGGWGAQGSNFRTLAVPAALSAWRTLLVKGI